MEYRELIKAIVSYRARNRLSREAFAKLANLSPMTVFYIENGKTKKPDATTVYKIMSVIENEVL